MHDLSDEKEKFHLKAKINYVLKVSNLLNRYSKLYSWPKKTLKQHLINELEMTEQKYQKIRAVLSKKVDKHRVKDIKH